MRAFGLAAVLLVSACRERSADIHRAPERELPRTPPAPSAAATVTSLVGYAGEQVHVVGRRDLSARPRIAWAIPGKTPAMIEVAVSGLVIVAHVAEPPDCSGEVLLTGKVIVARGMIKQGTTEGDWAEPQLDVLGWVCR